MKTRILNLAVWTLCAAALSGCGGSKLVMTGAATAPEPVGLMALESSEPTFGRELSQQLSALGYNVIDNSKTASLLHRLGRRGYPVEESETLAALRSCLVDAVLTARTDAAAAMGFNMGSTLLDKVQLRLIKTSSGETVAGMDWTNSWGGMPGSPADGMMRKSTPAAARELAAALAQRLGPPGPRTTLKCPERAPASPALAAAVPAAPRITSDVDAPRYSSPPRPEDFAVVVGIENYSRLPAASHAERDADAVKRHLLALGLPERNIVMLQGQRAVRSQLAAYLEEWLPKNVRPESSVFFYYSGHGAPDPKTGQAFLLPWDGDPVFLQSTAYPVKKLYSQLAALKVRRTVVALDACFSGAGGRSVLAPGTKPLVTKLEEMTPGGEVTLFTASAGDEITGSLDEQGHGMFTYYFLKALDQGKRRSRDIYDYLKPKVQDEARRQNREQSPAFFGPDEYLGPNAAAQAPTLSGEGERQPSEGDAPLRVEPPKPKKPQKSFDDQL